ncbi:hypothetical protein R9X47_22680 [Wukongibacter baidiensis]|uniref:hypothetical protein n=1 Tax=Wukongibacter baidiensis TaxID=1723361 RepID=UPI003D7F54A7
MARKARKKRSVKGTGLLTTHIANTIENGAITSTRDLPNGGKIVFKFLNIDGAEVWVKEFIEEGMSRL